MLEPEDVLEEAFVNHLVELTLMGDLYRYDLAVRDLGPKFAGRQPGLVELAAQRVKDWHADLAKPAPVVVPVVEFVPDDDILSVEPDPVPEPKALRRTKTVPKNTSNAVRDKDRS
jgi:hypothetical protein